MLEADSWLGKFQHAHAFSFPCCVPEFSDCQCDPVIQGYQALSEDPQVLSTPKALLRNLLPITTHQGPLWGKVRIQVWESPYRAMSFPSRTRHAVWALGPCPRST